MGQLSLLLRGQDWQWPLSGLGQFGSTPYSCSMTSTISGGLDGFLEVYSTGGVYTFCFVLLEIAASSIVMVSITSQKGTF